MKHITILGLGYIGLPTAAMFASHGVKVLGIDIDETVCEIINNGGVHIKEPFLGEIVKAQVANKMISCSGDVETSDAFIIAVPTPITVAKKADLSHIMSAGKAIAKVLKPGNIVILESTVPPRCTMDVLRPVLEKSGLKAGEDFYLAHCPERVLPGQIIYELIHNNRVIGGINRESAEKARALYSVFVEGEMYLTDTVTAELCKLMENTYRDVNIALANELARISERLGTNAWDVLTFANKHPRVNIHEPGPGVGGHCLAIDPWFIVQSAQGIAPIIKLARDINDSMPQHIEYKIRQLAPLNSNILILGLAYKPNIDDMRESPIIALVDLLKEDYTVNIVDPFIPPYDVDVYCSAENVDLIVLAVHHQEFSEIDFRCLANMVKTPVLLDTRNFYTRSDIEQSGFEYHLLGASDDTQFIHDTKRQVATIFE